MYRYITDCRTADRRRLTEDFLWRVDDVEKPVIILLLGVHLRDSRCIADEGTIIDEKKERLIRVEVHSTSNINKGHKHNEWLTVEMVIWNIENIMPLLVALLNPEGLIELRHHWFGMHFQLSYAPCCALMTLRSI